MYVVCISTYAGGEAEQYDALLKLVLVGDSNVGKTALLSRFVDDNFGANLISTIGREFFFGFISLGFILKHSCPDNFHMWTARPSVSVCLSVHSPSLALHVPHPILAPVFSRPLMYLLQNCDRG